MLAQRHCITDGTATAKAMDYTFKRWSALVCYADEGRVPMDNNRIENQIRPWALGRKEHKNASFAPWRRCKSARYLRVSL